jgi:hypothetical protein
MTAPRVPIMPTSSAPSWAVLMIHPRLPARFLCSGFRGTPYTYASRDDARDFARRNREHYAAMYGVKLRVVPVTAVVTAQPSHLAARRTAARIAP